MIGVAVTILVFIAGYTFVTFAYRKPNKPYEPYHDTKTRVNTARLLEAGYRRIELPVELPDNHPTLRNAAFPAPGGLPAELKSTLVAVPLLPAEVVEVDAAGGVSANAPYEIKFRCSLPDDQRQLGSVEVYLKDDSVILTPNFERLSGGLQLRTRHPAFRVVIPPDTFTPGTVQLSLIGEQTSRVWTLRVTE